MVATQHETRHRRPRRRIEGLSPHPTEVVRLRHYAPLAEEPSRSSIVMTLDTYNHLFREDGDREELAAASRSLLA
jgi:hypothetical protein